MKKVDAGEVEQQLFGRSVRDLRQRRIYFEESSTLSKRLFFGAIGQETEVTDAHETIRQDVEQKAFDKLVGVENRCLFPIAVLAIAIAQSDLAMIDREDPIVGKRHAVSVAAEIVENDLR
jgi:hypothetical protein